MNIQGPTGPPPVDNNEPVSSVTPGTASAATRNVAQTPVASVQVQLSPTLFQQGQILEAVISKIEQDALLLVLQNKLLDARGQPLNIQFRTPSFPGAEVGQQLTLQVTEVKQNQPVLQLLSVSKSQDDLLAQLTQALTNNRPLQSMFEHLLAAKQLPPNQVALPATVREQLDRLWRTLPEATQLQRPDNLRQALKNAGPFLESHLAKIAMGSTERLYPAMDVRAQLLRLAEALRQQTPQTQNTPGNATPPTPASATPLSASPLATPATGQTAQATAPHAPATPLTPRTPAVTSAQESNLPNALPRQTIQYEGLKAEQILQQLLQQTDAGLARIQQQQVQMSQVETRPQWLMELPIKHGDGVDVFDIRIQPDAEQQGHAHRDQQYPWTVMLAFNLDGLGPVRAQISLFNGQISSYWWAEQNETVQLFHEHRAFLENRLQHAGVPFQQLVCECGIPEPRTVQTKLPYSDTNLDELA